MRSRAHQRAVDFRASKVAATRRKGLDSLGVGGRDQVEIEIQIDPVQALAEDAGHITVAGQYPPRTSSIEMADGVIVEDTNPNGLGWHAVFVGRPPLAFFSLRRSSPALHDPLCVALKLAEERFDCGEHSARVGRTPHLEVPANHSELPHETGIDHRSARKESALLTQVERSNPGPRHLPHDLSDY